MISDFDQTSGDLTEKEDAPTIKKVKEKRGHALEKFFNVPEESTEMERVLVSYPLKKSGDYDDKDSEIEKEFHDVFRRAMEGYESLSDILDKVEPKYRARIAEVAATYLNTALNASTKRAGQKESIHKIKQKQQEIDKKASGSRTTNNIVFNGDRNEFLKFLRGDKEEREPIDITPDPDSND